MTLDWDGLSAAIRMERARRKWTQIGMAERMGLSITTLKNVEGGRTYRKPPVAALQAIDRVFEWPAGTSEEILRREPSQPDETVTKALETPPLSPSLQPLAERLPKRVAMELDNGEVLDTEIYDLTVGGGTKMITIVVADPVNGPRDYEELRKTIRAFERFKRFQHGQKPLPWEPGDPEEWKNDSGN